MRLDLHVHTRFSKDSSAPIASVVRSCRYLAPAFAPTPKGIGIAMLNVGWLSTGRGEGSLGLLRFVQDRILAGKLAARIQFVFSNRAPGEAEGSDRFFDQVNEYGLPWSRSPPRPSAVPVQAPLPRTGTNTTGR